MEQPTKTGVTQGLTQISLTTAVQGMESTNGNDNKLRKATAVSFLEEKQKVSQAGDEEREKTSGTAWQVKGRLFQEDVQHDTAFKKEVIEKYE